MNTLLLTLFVLLWGLIVYHHVIFPLIMTRLQKRSAQSPYKSSDKSLAPVSPETLRSVCILVPAYNEADVIADKIRNVASLDYPVDKLELIIACDGCTDETAALARLATAERENRHLNVRVLSFSKNSGKVATLNYLIPQIDADIIALSDASALISMDALQIANRHFDQTDVGVVAATYRLLNPGSDGEQKYWDYQVSIKQGEAAIGSPVGVHGALYFFRKALFTPLAADTINDDFILPMQIVSEGYRAVYDCNLIGLELEQASLDMDQKRRIRIAAGNFQQMIRLPGLWSPKLGGTAFSFISGKALRALMPLILLAQLIICLLLALSYDSFALFSLLQVFGISLARLSLLLPDDALDRPPVLRAVSKPLKLVFYLINGYYSCLIGTFRYLLKLDRGHWQSVSKS